MTLGVFLIPILIKIKQFQSVQSVLILLQYYQIIRVIIILLEVHILEVLEMIRLLNYKIIEVEVWEI
jgi:hypothetical protein